jgi:DNA-binding SARP family transcriptional activator
VQDAIESLKRLIQNDGKNYRLYLELAQCYLASGDKRKAEETLGDFQRLGIRNAHIMELLARIQS